MPLLKDVQPEVGMPVKSLLTGVVGVVKGLKTGRDGRDGLDVYIEWNNNNCSLIFHYQCSNIEALTG